MRTPRKATAGFTIIEVVLAMGILLLGMTSILGMLSFGAALSRTAQLRASAAAAAEAVVLDLEETLFPLLEDPDTGQLVVGEPRKVVDRPVPGHPGILYSATAEPDPSSASSLSAASGQPLGNPTRYRVDVHMRWTSSGQARSRVFTTLLLREVPFGERMRRLFVSGAPLDGPASAGAAPGDVTDVASESDQ